MPQLVNTTEVRKKLPKCKNAKALAKERFFLSAPYENSVNPVTPNDGSEFYEHKYIAEMLNTTNFFVHP
jgi:IS30 family transposase